MKNIRKTIYVFGLVLVLIMSCAASVFAFEIEYIDGNGYYYKLEDSGVTLLRFIGNGNIEELALPSEFDGCPLTKIGGNGNLGYCFGNVKKLIIPNSVKTICDYAFEQDGPEIIDIGTGINKIGRRALMSVENVVLRCDNPPSVGSMAFSSNTIVYVKDTGLFYEKIDVPRINLKSLNEYTGTILSQGSIITIAAVSVIAIVAVVFLILRKKKKTVV